MKSLYLVRHAKSSWDFPKLADIDRPLNHRGEKNAPEMGERLKKQGILPDLLISSPAKRAYTTAVEIAKKIGYPMESIQKSMKIYHSGEDELLKVLKNQDNDRKSVMLFGHNPGFTWFANSLAGVDIDNIPTAGIVAIDFEVNDWTDVDFEIGKLVFFDYPKKKS